MNPVTVSIPPCPRSKAPLMTYDQYRLLMIQLQARGNRRTSVEEVEQYYGLCLEIEAGYSAVKAEVILIADRLIKSYRKNGAAYARQSPVYLLPMPTEEQSAQEPVRPLELVFVKTGNAIQDFYALFWAAHDLAARSLGWPAGMFATKVTHG